MEMRMGVWRDVEREIERDGDGERERKREMEMQMGVGKEVKREMEMETEKKRGLPVCSSICLVCLHVYVLFPHLPDHQLSFTSK